MSSLEGSYVYILCYSIQKHFIPLHMIHGIREDTHMDIH